MPRPDNGLFKETILLTINCPARDMNTQASNTLDVDLSTPMGNIDGKMTLNIDGTTLTGSLTAMGKGGDFSGGTIDAEGNISLSGTIKAPMWSMNYTMTGTFRDGKLDAVAATKMGNITIQSK